MARFVSPLPEPLPLMTLPVHGVDYFGYCAVSRMCMASERKGVVVSGVMFQSAALIIPPYCIKISTSLNHIVEGSGTNHTYCTTETFSHNPTTCRKPYHYSSNIKACLRFPPHSRVMNFTTDNFSHNPTICRKAYTYPFDISWFPFRIVSIP